MTAGEKPQYVEFGIGSERCALRIHDIHEIIKPQEITPLPHVRAYVKGVINLRGRIVPVISLRGLFGMEEAAFSKATRIIVVNHLEDSVGIIVDRVNKVTTFDDIQPPPDRFGGLEGYVFTGIGLDGGGLVGILRLYEVLVSKQERWEC